MAGRACMDLMLLRTGQRQRTRDGADALPFDFQRRPALLALAAGGRLTPTWPNRLLPKPSRLQLAALSVGQGPLAGEAPLGQLLLFTQTGPREATIPLRFGFSHEAFSPLPTLAEVTTLGGGLPLLVGMIRGILVGKLWGSVTSRTTLVPRTEFGPAWPLACQQMGLLLRSPQAQGLPLLTEAPEARGLVLVWGPPPTEGPVFCIFRICPMVILEKGPLVLRAAVLKKPASKCVRLSVGVWYVVSVGASPWATRVRGAIFLPGAAWAPALPVGRFFGNKGSAAIAAVAQAGWEGSPACPGSPAAGVYTALVLGVSSVGAP